MTDQKKEAGWVSNPPVNEQRAAPVRDGQPHAPPGVVGRKQAKGTMLGPQPEDTVVLAFAREERRKRTKQASISKVALAKHIKSFVPPKPK